MKNLDAPNDGYQKIFYDYIYCVKELIRSTSEQQHYFFFGYDFYCG